ncbi:MAG: hypothetical protein NC548_27550 [Lachnospiraceae bacterium]|nr:hypothetical protein [Lachnospiraceae bacterium]
MAKKEIKKSNTSQSRKSKVWTSESVDKWMKDYSEGTIHKETPWLDGTIGIRNPNIVFEYTSNEIEELTKCAKDITYFANNYCYCLQGSRGYQPLTLRDYQYEMLDSYVNNRFTISLTSRQTGKCCIDANVEIKENDGSTNKTTIEELFYSKNEKKTFIQKIKMYLYHLYHKL